MIPASIARFAQPCNDVGNPNSGSSSGFGPPT